MNRQNIFTTRAEVHIQVENGYDLSKLLEIGFREVSYKGIRKCYREDGILHRYTFIPDDSTHFHITIVPKSKRDLPYYIITLTNMSDNVRRYIDYTLQRKENG